VIKGYSEEYPSQLDIQNCVIYHYHNYSSSKVTENTIQYLKQSIINNNVIYRDVINWSYYSSSNPLFVNGALGKICNSVITNNYIFGACSGRYYNSSYSDNTFYSYDLTSNIYSSGSGNTIEHNIFSRSSSLTYYPTNKVNYFTLSKVFTCSGTFSNYYQLSEVSPAKGYATDGGDCGVHGGLFGCPSGGRPQYIPYFTKVRVNSRTENGKLPVSVSVKIQDE
jgi:hypothetical protein